MKVGTIFVLAAAVLGMAISAYAHHPFAAEYDWTQPVTLTGTVAKVEWTNPHTFLYIDANDKKGEMKHWVLEMGSPGALTRAGWIRNTLKIGDQVTVDAWMSKTKNDRANTKSVKLSDGHELSAASSIADIKPASKQPISN